MERIQLEEGLRLFNVGSFYDCHDLLEDLWLQESSDQRPFLQGIIQAAVAFFHHEEGRLGASRSMLQRSIEKLEPYPGDYIGVDLESFRMALVRWKDTLDKAISSGVQDPVSLQPPQINF